MAPPDIPSGPRSDLHRGRRWDFARWAASLLHIAREGLPFTLAPALLGVLALLTGWIVVGVVLILVACAVGSFFRDPERTTRATANAIIAAADGRVTGITESPLPGGQDDGRRYRRVAIFMSPLNVHVNRSPVTGRVLAVTHTAGEFRAAFRDTASESNERNLIVFGDSAGRRHAIMQIAGYLARRIVCQVRADEAVESGARIGLIMFGSRVDHFLPLDYRVLVTPGERVCAGETVIGELES